MGRLSIRLLMGLIIGLVGLVSYCTTSVENPITGEKQRVRLTQQEEIALGQQARSQMAGEFGGLYPDPILQEYIEQVGQRVVQRSEAGTVGYPFDFHLLGDPDTINAFALPGGQVFITVGLLRQMNSEAQLAGVLAHEVAHVIARHGAEHLAKQQLGAALVNAIGVATSDGQGSGREAAIIAQAVNQLVSLRYGRQDELESDRLGVEFMSAAGYNPNAMLEVMTILANARQGGEPPEFLSTHPNPANRLEQLEGMITEIYPNGVPGNLETGQEEFSQVVLSRF